MDSAVTPKPPAPMIGRIRRRLGSVLYGAAVLVFGTFGLYFTFANYPWLGVGVLLPVLLLTGYSERKRRAKQKSRAAARRRERARSHESAGR